MPAQGNFKKGTNQFMRMGHTTSTPYGNNVNSDAKGDAGEAAKEVKP